MLTPGRIIERYRVEELLGEGGTARVYRVRHVHLGTDHALKVMTLIGAQAGPRLLLEGRVQAGLRHPNVVAVTDVLEIDGAFGLLMEYVPPPSLATWIVQHPPRVELAEALFRGIVDGVRHAHQHGLVHRDLKPANVLLARGDVALGAPALAPKVADFGLARLLDDDGHRHTRSGLAMGTPQYMAPEQFRDAKGVDRRADLFSLGCILHELLSGMPAFAWSDLISVYTAMSNKAWAPLPPTVPERLRAAVAGCLEPDADLRIPDCGTLLAVLDGIERARGPTLVPGARELERLAGLDAAPSVTLLPTAAPAAPGDTLRLDPPTVVSPAVVSPADAAPSRRVLPAVAVALVLVAGVAYAVWPGAPEEPVAAVLVETPAPVPAPSPAPSPPAPEPTAEPVRALATPPASEPASRPAARVARPSVTVEPAPVPTASVAPETVAIAAPEADSRAAVRATGAPTVWLVGTGGRFPLPARVAPGRYAVWADFGAGGVAANEVTLAAGDDIELRCNDGFQSCPVHR